MSKTEKFEIDYLSAGQANKHLTVNDGFLKFDALMALNLGTPPALPEVSEEGVCYVVSNSDPIYSDHAGQIAIYTNGGYTFLSPSNGLMAQSEQKRKIYNGSYFESFGTQTKTFDVVLNENFTHTEEVMSANTVVLGITGRVIEEIVGVDVASWSIGVDDDPNRYGSGLWLGKNGWVRGLTGSPLTYWSDTPLTISPDNGNFTSGKIRLQIHYLELSVPPEV